MNVCRLETADNVEAHHGLSCASEAELVALDITSGSLAHC